MKVALSDTSQPFAGPVTKRDCCKTNKTILVAGFVLHAYGFERGEHIDTVSELGVTLLLFTIGLKLRTLCFSHLSQRLSRDRRRKEQEHQSHSQIDEVVLFRDRFHHGLLGVGFADERSECQFGTDTWRIRALFVELVIDMNSLSACIK